MLSYWLRFTTGPTTVFSSRGSPTFMASVALFNSSRNSS
jgi:hypothetical protein